MTTEPGPTRPERPRTPDHLVERADALLAVSETLTGAADGSTPRAGIILVEAHSGLGLSSVLDRSCEEAATSWRVVAVRADEHDAVVPLSVAHRIDAALASPGTLPAPIDTEAAMVAELAGRLARATDAAPARPVLVAIDDAHLCDAASMRVLRTVWSRCEGLPVALLIGTLLGTLIGDRPDDTPELELLRRAADLTIALSPLTLLGSAQLLHQRCVDIDGASLACVHELAGGRPAELELVTRSRGDDAAGTPTGRWLVGALAGRRIAELTPQARRMLEIITVLDVRLDTYALGTMSGCPFRTDECVAELRATGLLARDEPLRCSHGAIADIVRGGVKAADAGGLARSALTVAIDAGAGPDVLVPLAETCDPTGDPVVAHILSDAGDRCIRAGQPAQALAYLRRALNEPPSPDHQIAIRSQLALASALADEPGATALVRSAAMQLDAVAAAQLARRAGGILAGHGRSREATALIDSIREHLGSTSHEVASILDTGWLAAARLDLSMRPAVRRRVADVSKGSTSGSQGELDSSPSGRALAAMKAYELTLAGEDRPRAVELARHGVDHRAGSSLTSDLGSIWIAVLALQFADELDDAATALDRLERRGIQRESEADVVSAHHLRMSIERLRGHLDAAERSASIVADATGRGWRVALPGGAGNRCRLALLRGRPDLAEAHLEVPGGIDRFADDPSLVELLDARGHLRFVQGRYAESLEDHLRVRDRHEALGAVNPATILWSQGAARALAASGRRSEAIDLLGAQLALARTWGAARPVGALLTTSGTLTAGRAGEEMLEEAVDVLGAGVAPIELAQAHVALGRSAQLRGDARKAERSARQARVLAEAAGAMSVATEAQSILGDVAARPRRRAADGLTPSELRTARLAAAGATNAEIAAELYVTRKAVEYHLSNVYRKLGIAGRRDLPANLTAHES